MIFKTLYVGSFRKAKNVENSYSEHGTQCLYGEACTAKYYPQGLTVMVIYARAPAIPPDFSSSIVRLIGSASVSLCSLRYKSQQRGKVSFVF